MAGFIFCGLLRLVYQLTHKRLIRTHLRINQVFLIIGVFLPTLIWSGLFAFFFLTSGDSEMRLLEVSYSDRQLRTTVSIGIAGMQPDYRRTSESLIRHADEALYRAKHDGRNQVCTHAPPLRRRA